MKTISVRITLYFLGFMLLTRALLLSYAIYLKQDSFCLNTLLVFSAGALYDICTILYFLPIPLLLSIFSPSIFKNKYVSFFLIASFSFYLIMNGIAELLFWDEFGTRFNFIAVDYLVYMDEVVKNIYQSYPIIKISFFAIIGSLLIAKILNKAAIDKSRKTGELLTVTALLILTNFSIDSTTIDLPNRYQNELAHNGIYNLFAAFKNNSLNYPTFYKTIDNKEAFQTAQKLLGAKVTGKPSLERFINNSPFKGYNVILITVESLSAEYMKTFGSKHNLTPFLDHLKSHSLFFSNFYATGTRTVRGLEAITLSIPPTPGNSIVRRQNNENLFSLGSVLKQYNYSAKFLYGGFGYFDNMNYFFANNNFSTIDRANFNDNEVTFSNAWGVADGDLYKKALTEADKDFSKGNKFFYFLMTTSNHRPFTYPENTVAIPSGTGRYGAVQYTDYALKKLIEEAQHKPWFKDTVFVITADHCAGSSGKSDLPIKRYHIPLLIYAPNIIFPAENQTLGSQVDIAPTVLSILGISYKNKSYGSNLINSPANRAFIGTYQKLGLYTPGSLIVLGPKKQVSEYKINQDSQILTKVNKDKMVEAVSLYQTAYELFNRRLFIP